MAMPWSMRITALSGPPSTPVRRALITIPQPSTAMTVVPAISPALPLHRQSNMSSRQRSANALRWFLPHCLRCSFQSSPSALLWLSSRLTAVAGLDRRLTVRVSVFY